MVPEPHDGDRTLYCSYIYGGLQLTPVTRAHTYAHDANAHFRYNLTSECIHGASIIINIHLA